VTASWPWRRQRDQRRAAAGLALGRSSSWYHCSSMPRSGFARQDGTKRRAAQPFVIAAARLRIETAAGRAVRRQQPRSPRRLAFLNTASTSALLAPDGAGRPIRLRPSITAPVGPKRDPTVRLVIARHQRIAANIGSVRSGLSGRQQMPSRPLGEWVEAIIAATESNGQLVFFGREHQGTTIEGLALGPGTTHAGPCDEWSKGAWPRVRFLFAQRRVDQFLGDSAPNAFDPAVDPRMMRWYARQASKDKGFHAGASLVAKCAAYARSPRQGRRRRDEHPESYELDPGAGLCACRWRVGPGAGRISSRRSGGQPR
jgi:hypothetical protein